MIYNYILCWLYSMTKSVIITLILFLVFCRIIVLGLVLNWWRIKHELKISAVSQLACEKFARRLTREKGMWEAHAGSWRVMPGCQFHECLMRRANPRGTHKTLYLENFKCDLLTLHPYYIYPYYPQKYERLFREKNPR